MRERLALVLCLGSLLGVASDAGANWPMPRANIRRTGVAEGTLGVSLPAVRWKRYLGGGAPDDAFEWFVATEVGSHDVVYLAASDRLEARRPDSTLLWQTPLDGVRTVLGRVDVDGDGDLEIVAIAGFAGRAYVFDAATGSQLWASPEGRYLPTIWGMRLRDVTGDGLPDLFLSAQSYGGNLPGSWADLYSFASGAATPTTVFSIDQSSRDYDRGGFEAFADLDGDGREELFAEGSRTVYAYSTVDGSVVATGDVGFIPWALGATAVADLDADGDDEVVLLTNASYNPEKNTRHVLVVDLVGGALVVKWQRDVADNQQDRHEFNAESVTDVDGDGHPEVVSSFYDHVTGVWTTNVWNGPDGALRASFPGAFAGADDLDGDGTAEVIVRSAPGVLGLTAWDVDGALPTVKWSLANVDLPREPDPGKVGRQHQTDRTIRFQVEPYGPPALLLLRRDSSSWKLIAIDGGDSSPTPLRVHPLPAGVTFGSIRVQELQGGPRVMAVRSDGFMMALDENLTPTNELHYPGGIVPGLRIGGWFTGFHGLGSSPVAADLFGDGRDDIIVRDSRGALVALDTHGGSMSNPPGIVWDLFGQRWSPSLADLDGDGQFEVLTGDVGALVARSGETGAALWTAPVTGGDAGYTSGVDLDGDGLPEIGFVTHDASTGHQVYGFVDGAGAALWPEHTRYAAGGGFGFFSVGDVTGDGLPDVIAQAGNNILSIDGQNGALRGETQGTVTTAPLLWDLTADGVFDVLSNGFGDYSKVWTVLSGVPVVASAISYGSEIAGYQYGSMVTCPDGLRFAFAHTNSPHVRVIDPVLSTVRFEAYLAAGAAHASDDGLAMDAPPFVGNLNAVMGTDGEPRWLAGSADGHLYVLHACAAGPADLIDWTMDFGATVGEPILADVDDDPEKEILVSVVDGNLYAIDTEPTAGPSMFKAFSVGAGEVTLRWDAAPGAVGYEVAVQDGVGGFVTEPPFLGVGAVTHVTLHDLELAPDVPYFAFVRAVGADGQRSFERMSEGFRSGGAVEDPTLDQDEQPPAGCGCRAGGDRGGGGPALAGLLFLAGAIVLRGRRRR